jgi:threonine aldolase
MADHRSLSDAEDPAMKPAEPIVDLRSDTVTRPTPAMRRAIAEAEVGDDVFGDDPTVIELERRVAALASKEAALFVPSGTMGNQLAVQSQTSPGEEVLLETESHIFLYEQGGIAANSGALAHVIRGVRGVIDPAEVQAAARDSDDDHDPRLALLCMENTHNRAGGAVIPLDAMRRAAEAAHALGARVHLDGARLWNASVATGVPIRDWVAPVDTVMMCFSKGLGAPIGSILVGDRVTVRRARRLRKRMGGSMRQVGILAAAGLYAIDHHIERLADDHRRARTLADGLASIPGVRVVPCDTNIIYFDLDESLGDLNAVISAASARGVRVSAYGPRRLRAITHLDVDDAGISRALETFDAVLRAPAARGVDASGGPWYGSPASPHDSAKAAGTPRTSH